MSALSEIDPPCPGTPPPHVPPHVPPHRALDVPLHLPLHGAIPRDLLALVVSVSDAEIETADFVRMPGGYERASLVRPGDIDLALLRWPAGSSSPLHGHGDASAVLWLQSGQLVEHNFARAPHGFTYRRITLGRGGVHHLEPGTVHRIEVSEPTFGIHVYAPRPSDPVARIPEHEWPLLEAAWRGATGIHEALPSWLTERR